MSNQEPCYDELCRKPHDDKLKHPFLAVDRPRQTSSHRAIPNPQPDPLDTLITNFVVDANNEDFFAAKDKLIAAIQAHYDARFEEALGVNEDDDGGGGYYRGRNFAREEARNRWYSQEGGENENKNV